jgi:uncharacterized protein YdeI (YjbR/CyaY-like superfamily)
MAAPVPTDVVVFADAAGFRAWLEENHAVASELWVGYYKKGVAKTSISYPEAVEEALCFGWIDGIGRRIDDEVHANRYTPRRRGSGWSAINIAKVAELTTAGRMHPAGLRAFEERDRRKDPSYSADILPDDLPDEAQDLIRANPAAWTYWQQQPPGYRRLTTRWVLSAKRQETRERRLATLIEDCSAGRPIKPMRYGRAEG